jgi:hypothetical protein
MVNHLVPPARPDDLGVTNVFTYNATTDSYYSGMKMIGVRGRGELSIHAIGRDRWTNLAAHAKTGDTSIRIATPQAIDWRAGDEIIVVTSDYSPQQTERFHIRSAQFVQGATDDQSYTVLQLNETVAYNHYGVKQNMYGWNVDMRAEVANLESNVRISGEMVNSPTYYDAYYSPLMTRWPDSMA